MTPLTRIVALSLLLACPAATAHGSGEQLSQREYALLTRAFTLLGDEQYRQCLDTLQPLLDQKRPSHYALSYGSLCASNGGESSTAIRILTRAVTLYPDSVDFWHNLAILQMRAERFHDAVTSYRSLLALNADAPGDIRYNLAYAHYSLEQYRQAYTTLVAINTAEPVKPQWVLLKLYCLVQLKRWQEAEQTGLAFLARHPQHAESWRLLSQIAINRRQYDKAIACLEIVNLLAPSTAISAQLGQLYRFQSAWNEYLRVSDSTDTIEVARALIASQQYALALSRLEAGDSRTAPEATMLRGQVLFYLDRREEAVTALLAAANMVPEGAAEGRHNASEARSHRQSRDRIRASALLLAGQILWLEHKWEAARDVYKQLELLPGQAEIGRNLANCMQGLLMEQETRFEPPAMFDPPLEIEGVKTEDARLSTQKS